MAAAFLPWEKWLARLFHTLAIALRKAAYKTKRRRDLSRSLRWTETVGTVESVVWDTSFPREEIGYSYQTENEIRTGYYWTWFESPDEPQPQTGDKIKLRYNQNDPEESVFVVVQR
jgi:hypothetical protein